jgi:hypothetical protein
MSVKNDKNNVKPFGLQFLETPSEKEQKTLNGGVAAIKGPTRFHSMDIFRSNGVWHFNT